MMELTAQIDWDAVYLEPNHGGINSFQNDRGGYFSLPAKLLQLESLGGCVGVLMSILLAWVR